MFMSVQSYLQNTSSLSVSEFDNFANKKLLDSKIYIVPRSNHSNLQNARSGASSRQRFWHEFGTSQVFVHVIVSGVNYILYGHVSC